MADFATVPDIEQFLQIEITDADEIASAEQALKYASAAIRNYTKQYIEKVDSESIALDVVICGTKIYLPELPVVSVVSVSEDGILLVDGDDYKLGSYGILHQLNRPWKMGIQILEIIYTHGFDPIPDDVAGVCVRAASRAFQAGLSASEQAGVPGVASKSLGDFSVSYQTSSGSGNDGIMGASAARFLLMSEKDILDHYKIESP